MDVDSLWGPADSPVSVGVSVQRLQIPGVDSLWGPAPSWAAAAGVPAAG